MNIEKKNNDRLIGMYLNGRRGYEEVRELELGNGVIRIYYMKIKFFFIIK